jgi:hypothetical protein
VAQHDLKILRDGPKVTFFKPDDLRLNPKRMNRFTRVDFGMILNQIFRDRQVLVIVLPHVFFSCEKFVLLEQKIAGAAPTMFFAAMKNFGAAKNVVSVTQTTARVTEDPDCAAEEFCLAGKRFVGIDNRFVSSALKPGSGVGTSPDVIPGKAGLATRQVSRQVTFVLFATRSAAAAQWIVAGIRTFLAVREWFIFAANRFLFVTEKNLKIVPTGNLLIGMDVSSAGEELVDDGEELLDDGKVFVDEGDEFLDDADESLNEGDEFPSNRLEGLRHGVE